MNNSISHGCEDLNKIAIIAFMGAGKGCVGKEVAEIMGKDFIHIDQDDDGTLPLLNGQTIPDFIRNEDRGQYPFSKFRNVESRGEKKLLRETRKLCNVIYSSGGGTISQHQKLEENVKMLKNAGYTIVYMKTSLERINEFRKDDTEGNSKRVKIDQENIYNERCPIYEKYSDFTVENIKTVKDTALKIKNGYKFYKKIIPIRSNIDTYDTQLVGCFYTRESLYDADTMENINWNLISSENKQIVERYITLIVNGVSEKLGRTLSKFEINLLTNRLIQVALVAELKNKYSQEPVQNGRKAEVKQKYITTLGEPGGELYSDIIHRLSVKMEKEIMNRK